MLMTTAGSSPGFGVVVALVALMGAAILAYKRDSERENYPENSPEMTELERAVVESRLVDIEDESKLASVDEFLEDFDDLDEEGDGR